jgi:hypothetical protein
MSSLDTTQYGGMNQNNNFMMNTTQQMPKINNLNMNNSTNAMSTVNAIDEISSNVSS